MMKNLIFSKADYKILIIRFLWQICNVLSKSKIQYIQSGKLQNMECYLMVTRPKNLRNCRYFNINVRMLQFALYMDQYCM